MLLFCLHVTVTDVIYDITSGILDDPYTLRITNHMGGKSLNDVSMSYKRNYKRMIESIARSIDRIDRLLINMRYWKRNSIRNEVVYIRTYVFSNYVEVITRMLKPLVLLAYLRMQMHLQ